MSDGVVKNPEDCRIYQLSDKDFKIAKQAFSGNAFFRKTKREGSMIMIFPHHYQIFSDYFPSAELVEERKN